MAGMASVSNPVQQLLNAEKKAAIVVNDARTRKYRPTGIDGKSDVNNSSAYC